MKTLLIFFLLCATAFPVTVTIYNPSTTGADSIHSNTNPAQNFKGYQSRIATDVDGSLYAIVPDSVDGSGLSRPSLIVSPDAGTTWKKKPRPYNINQRMPYSGLFAWGDSCFAFWAGAAASTSLPHVVTVHKEDTASAYIDTLMATTGTSSYDQIAVAGLHLGVGYELWNFVGRDTNSVVPWFVRSSIGAIDGTGTWATQDSSSTWAAGARFTTPSGYIFAYEEASDRLRLAAWTNNSCPSTCTSIDTIATILGFNPSHATSGYGNVTMGRAAYDMQFLYDSTPDVGPVFGVAWMNKDTCLLFKKYLHTGTVPNSAWTLIGADADTIVGPGPFTVPTTGKPWTVGQPSLTVVDSGTYTAENLQVQCKALVLTYAYPPNKSYVDSIRICCKVSLDKGATWSAESTLVASGGANRSTRAFLSTTPHAYWGVPASGQITYWAGWGDSIYAEANTYGLDSVHFAKIVLTTSASAPTTTGLRRRKLLTARTPIDAPPISEQNVWMIKE